WKAGILWMLDDNNIRYATSWYKPELKNSRFISLTKTRTFKPGQPGPGKVISSKKPREYENYYGSKTHPRRSAATENGLQYSYLAPVIFDKEIFGVIEFVRTKPLPSPTDFKDILEILGTQVGQYVKRKQADVKLEMSEQKSKALVELAPAIIYTLDKNGLITSLNPTVEEITGIKEEELIGQPVTALICPDDREAVVELLEEQRLSEDLVSLEAGIITRKDANLFAEIKEKKILSRGSKIARIGIIRDVTDRYLLERQKDLWMGIATHELKTPLTSIKAFVQILQQRSKNKELSLYLQRINNLSDDMTNLIGDLLDITKIRTGTLQLVKERISLKSLIINNVKALQATTPSHTIRYAIKDDPCVIADKQRINQVLTNLLSNAIKYSPQETEIIVALQTHEDKVRVSVKDYGVGIEKKDLEEVFGLFYRSSNKATRNIFGMGLGLFISKAIIKAHGGKIWAESDLGKGSSFYFDLPRV
ncbi:MAG TPA: ATP-binding protein, partial [Ignavibacteriales bacterium]|nr:ATP-binding protein [Ignavibacteriales bacterium]